jgi:hypothetical protein
MLILLLKSMLTALSVWSLGSLARVADLSADADMCLLLRLELPRHQTDT